jgi:hypothetical protein
MTTRMFALRPLSEGRARTLVLASLLLTAFGLGWGTAEAEVKSLEIVPANVSAYFGIYNLEDACQRVLQSRAVSRLAELGSVRRLSQTLFGQIWGELPEEVQQQLTRELETPMVQESLALLVDMHSQEFFIAGGEEWNAFLRWVSTLDRLSTLSSIFGSLAESLPEEPLKSRHQIAEEIWQSLRQHTGVELQVPSLLFGWRVKNVDRAASLMNILRSVIFVSSLGIPQLAGKVWGETIDGGDFTVITISGEDVPWEDLLTLAARTQESDGSFELRFEDGHIGEEIETTHLEVSSEELVPPLLLEQLRKQRLVIAFGMREDWIHLALGPDTRILRLPPAGARLADRQEIQELLGRLEASPVSLSFQSREFLQELKGEFSPEEVEVYRQCLGKWEALPAELRKQLDRDLQELANWFEKFRGESGPRASAASLTARGLEELTFTWIAKAEVAPLPLRTIPHLGAAPVAAGIASQVPLPGMYEFIAWLLGRAWYYVDYGIRRTSGEEELLKWRNISARLRRLAREADKIVRRELLPALDGFEMAVVVDAELRSEQWLETLPYSENPLPVPEVAAVVAVADRDKLVAAYRQARELWRQLRAVAEDADSDELFEQIESSLPSIIHRRLEWGDVWQLEVGGPWLDARIRPTLALGQKAFIFCLSEEHAKRLLEPKPLQPVGLIEDMEKPRIWAAWVNLEKLWDALRPWAEHLTATVSQADWEIPEEFQDSLEELRKEIDSLVAGLKCLRSITFEYSVESPNLVVRRALVEIRDLAN